MDDANRDTQAKLLIFGRLSLAAISGVRRDAFWREKHTRQDKQASKHFDFFWKSGIEPSFWFMARV